MHVGFAGGGVVPKLYDQGGRLDAGLSVVANKTRRPEAILTDSQWRTMHALAERNLTGPAAQAGVQIGAVYGHDAREVGLEIERERRKREALYGGVR